MNWHGEMTVEAADWLTYWLTGRIHIYTGYRHRSRWRYCRCVFTYRELPTELTMSSIAEFDFFPPNHSVARSDWGYPCIPYESLGAGRVGFFSGFQPVGTVEQNVSINFDN